MIIPESDSLILQIVFPSLDGREEPIRSLSRGDYFGEQALLKTDVRTANVIAESDDVECLSLDREHFFQGRLDLKD